MVDYAKVQLLGDSQVLEMHEFPLFEYPALFQKLESKAQNLRYECIAVALEVLKDYEKERLLNLICASGYVPEESDLTFRHHDSSGFFYAYFNFTPLS